MNEEQLPIIRASELGAYRYCERQWWLERMEMARPVSPNREHAFKRGEQYHQDHAEKVRLIEQRQKIATILLALIAACLAGWLFAWAIT